MARLPNADMKNDGDGMEEDGTSIDGVNRTDADGNNRKNIHSR